MQFVLKKQWRDTCSTTQPYHNTHHPRNLKLFYRLPSLRSLLVSINPTPPLFPLLPPPKSYIPTPASRSSLTIPRKQNQTQKMPLADPPDPSVTITPDPFEDIPPLPVPPCTIRSAPSSSITRSYLAKPSPSHPQNPGLMYPRPEIGDVGEGD